MSKELATQAPSVPGFLSTNAPAEVPKFAQSDAGAGSENVGADEQATPQLKVANPLSPEVIAEDVKVGKLFNSVTKEEFDELYVANIFFRRQWAVFYKRTSAKSGLADTFTSEADAKEYVESHQDKNELEIQDTHIHSCVAFNESGIAFPFQMYLKSTGLSMSRAWNTSLEQMNKGMARFYSIWKLSSDKKSNTKGTWYIPKAEFVGYLEDETVYNNVKAVYESVAGNS